MCKNWETLQNGLFWESLHRPRAQACAMACASWWYDSGMGQSRAGLGAWPVAFDVGPSQMLMCSCVHFACGATLRNGTGSTLVRQQWWALDTRCNGWIERRRLEGAVGARSNTLGKPLVLTIAARSNTLGKPLVLTIAAAAAAAANCYFLFGHPVYPADRVTSLIFLSNLCNFICNQSCWFNFS